MGRWTNITAEERFSKRVTVDEDTGCWLWTGAVGRHGYGEITDNGRPWLAHRWIYQLLIGPIEPGHHLHHKCETKRCVNPTHLQIVTPREHFLLTPQSDAHRRMLQTHCKRGHEFTPANTYVNRRGHRACRECAATATYIRNHGIDDRTPKVQR